MFTQKFDAFAIQGDSITTCYEGFTITATILNDDWAHIDDDDTHNPDQSVTGCDKDQQSRLIAAREAWKRDEWNYCGIVLSVTKNGVPITDNAAAIWGLECNYPGSDNSYLAEVANDLLPEAIETAKTELARIKAALA